MPFVGVKENEKVTPEQIGDDEIVKCPSCGELMKPRSSHHRKINGKDVFIARHFWHFESSDNACSGGESYQHQRMKSIALSKLKEIFDYSDSGLEKKVGEKRPDVYIEFPEPQDPYGKGICVEIQYRHKGKNIEETNESFFDEEYSVCWLEENDFHNKNVNIVDNILSYWPYAIPVSNETNLDITKFGGKQKVEGFLHWTLLFPKSSIFNPDEFAEIFFKEYKLVGCSICGKAKKVTKGINPSDFICSSCKKRKREDEKQKGIDEYSWKKSGSWKNSHSNIKRIREKQANLRKTYDSDKSWREVLDEL